jgi:hypothetical protein
MSCGQLNTMLLLALFKSMAWNRWASSGNRAANHPIEADQDNVESMARENFSKINRWDLS